MKELSITVVEYPLLCGAKLFSLSSFSSSLFFILIISFQTSKKTSPKKEAPLAMEDRHGSTTDENFNLIGDNSVVGTWSRNGEKYTPRKNTPPLPHLKKKPEFRTIFTENVF